MVPQTRVCILRPRISISDMASGAHNSRFTANREIGSQAEIVKLIATATIIDQRS